MKVDCPRCGEKVEYVPDSVQTCSYCKTPVKMPEADKLPEDLRGRWLKEQEAAWLREQKKQQKLEAAKAKQKEAAKAKQLAEEKKAAEAVIKEQELEAELHAIKKSEEVRKQRQETKKSEAIPERGMTDEYPGLDTYIGMLGLAIALFVIAGGFMLLIGLSALAGDNELSQEATTVLITYGITLLVVGVIPTWGMIEFVRLAKNVARDAKISRELLTRLAYPPDTEKPTAS